MSQIASLARCPLTTLKRFRDREKLFEAGQRDFKFIVVKSGKVEIVEESGEMPKTVAIQGAREMHWRRCPTHRHTLKVTNGYEERKRYVRGVIDSLCFLWRDQSTAAEQATRASTGMRPMQNTFARLAAGDGH